jgi:hypothetical protein
MMSYERWLEYILEIIRVIASREDQEKIWLGPRPEINWVGDLYNELGEEFFDDFFKTYSGGFTSEQVTAWNQFKETFEEYGDKLPSYPEPRMVIDDPDWQLVREAAARFVIAFEKKHPEPSISGK